MQTTKIAGWASVYCGEVLMHARESHVVVSETRESFEGDVPADCYLCAIESEEAFLALDAAWRAKRVGTSLYADDVSEDLFASVERLDYEPIVFDDYE